MKVKMKQLQADGTYEDIYPAIIDIRQVEKKVTELIEKPVVVDIDINPTATLCRVPIEVLRTEETATDTVVKSESANFVDNANYVFANDAVKLKTNHVIPMSTATIDGSYLSESGDIDFKKVESVAISATDVGTGNSVKVVEVVSRNASSFFLMSDGTVKACGDNQYGQLGLGDTTNRSAPVLIPNLTGVKQISAAGNTTFFLIDDGSVKVCGKNAIYAMWVKGVGNILVPTLISSISDAKYISGCTDFMFYIANDGNVKAYGCNTGYSLGLGDVTTANTPTIVPNMTGAIKIYATLQRVVFLMDDGSIKTHGANGNAQLGLGNTLPTTTPTLIPNFTGVKQVAVSEWFTLFLMTDGSVKVCGLNNNNMFRIDGAYNVLTPTSIPDLTGVKQVTAAGNFIFLLMTDGSAKAYSYNIPVANFPTLVAGAKQILVTFFTIGVTGYGSVFFLMDDGSVKSYGSNIKGQLGLGDTVDRSTPITIPSFVQIAAYYAYLKNFELYTEKNATLTMITADYTSLESSAKKTTIEANGSNEVAAVDKLNTLGSFKILKCTAEAGTPTCTVTAIPKLSLLIPKKLITAPAIGSVALAAQGQCKVYVTTDLAAYKGFDFTSRTWKDDIGINADDLPKITQAEWAALQGSGSQIAFACELDMEAVADATQFADLTISTYANDGWAMATPGSDYKYGYPASNILQVSLLTNGSYKINYQK